MYTIEWEYVEPLIDEKSIAMFENENKVQLPNDIVMCIKKNNGGYPNRNTFDTQLSKERIFKTLLSFNKGDIEDVFSAVNILQEDGNSLIPLASDPSGNYICYDDKDGIVLWLHETNTIEKIAESFTEFLNKLY